VSDTFTAGFGKEDVTDPKFERLLPASLTDVHVVDAVQNGKDCISVVDMPLLGLGGPMESDGDA